MLAETTGANVIRTVHSLRGIHAQKDAAGNWEWMLEDGLGSVRGVVDNTVGVLESRNYDPYGNAFGATGTSQTAYGFTGELVDGSGLLDLRARRYNPALGVFASLDPLETANRYAYVSEDPINRTDPTGLQDTGCTIVLNALTGQIECVDLADGQIIAPPAPPIPITWIPNPPTVRPIPEPWPPKPEPLPPVTDESPQPPPQPLPPQPVPSQEPGPTEGVTPTVTATPAPPAPTATATTNPTANPAATATAANAGFCTVTPSRSDEKDDCPNNSHKIKWPTPVWLTAGHGDTGATTGINDYPPKVITKIPSPVRNNSYQQYVGINQAVYNSQGGSNTFRIHHKWPLFLGGPDAVDNLVFMTIQEHLVWHTVLYSQGVTGYMPQDPNGTVYCVT